MKFSLEPYKLFNKKDVVEFISLNLNGSFAWKGYKLSTKPDRKFGHNMFEYFLQIPVIGLVLAICLVLIFTPIVYISIFVQQVKGQ